MSSEILEIKIQASINEFTAIAQQPLHKAAIETWLSDYKELWEETFKGFGLPALEFIHGRTKSEFDQIYRLFTDLIECYSMEVICLTAMSEYHAIVSENKNVHGNEPLQQWVRKNEQLDTNYEIITSLHYDDDVNYVSDIYGVTYFISGNQFKNIIEFRKIFSHLFWEEKILPDRIAQIREKEEQDRIKRLEEDEQNTKDNTNLLCYECKPFGYCKNNPPECLTQTINVC